MANNSSSSTFDEHLAISDDSDHQSWDAFHTEHEKVYKYCGNLYNDMSSHKMIWLGLKLFFIVTALPANGALVWLLFKPRHNLSPSEILGFNMSILNILYCLSFLLKMCLRLSLPLLNRPSFLVYHIIRSLSALNMFGCPLFLTLMCLERYLAAAFPIRYQQLSRRKHRIVLSALVWCSTVFVTLILFFLDAFKTVLVLVVIILVFLLIMFFCLAGIVYVLYQSKPGDGASSRTLMMKGALSNIITVIVPSVIAYMPLVAAGCYSAFLISVNPDCTHFLPVRLCTVLQYLLVFPNIGLYIGPLFYRSMIRKIICCKTAEEPSEPQAPDQ